MSADVKPKSYNMTKRAKEGYECFGRWLHITGVDNVFSLIVWHILDVEMADINLVDAAYSAGPKRIDYVYTPERTTASMSISDATKARFERMYVTAGLNSFGAAIDLLGIAINFENRDPVFFKNGFTNPFYLAKDGNRVTVRVHGKKPLYDRQKFDFDYKNDGFASCPDSSAYNFQFDADENIDFSVQSDTNEPSDDKIKMTSFLVEPKVPRRKNEYSDVSERFSKYAGDFFSMTNLIKD